MLLLAPTAVEFLELTDALASAMPTHSACTALRYVVLAEQGPRAAEWEGEATRALTPRDILQYGHCPKESMGARRWLVTLSHHLQRVALLAF